MDPTSNKLSPKAPSKVKVLNCMEANNMSAKPTFKNPSQKTIEHFHLGEAFPFEFKLRAQIHLTHLLVGSELLCSSCFQ